MVLNFPLFSEIAIINSARCCCRLLLIHHHHLPEVLLRIDILLSGCRCGYSVDLRRRRRVEDFHCVRGGCRNSWQGNPQNSLQDVRILPKIASPEKCTVLFRNGGRGDGKKKKLSTETGQQPAAEASGRKSSSEESLLTHQKHTVGLSDVGFCGSSPFFLLYSRFIH